MSNAELTSKVHELRELRRMAEELAAEIEGITDALKNQMEAHGVDELRGADWKVSWKSVTSSRVDTSALKKALPDLVEQFTKKTTTRRFTVA